MSAVATIIVGAKSTYSTNLLTTLPAGNIFLLEDITITAPFSDSFQEPNFD